MLVFNMNFYITAGILLIAVGTFVMIFGQLEKSVVHTKIKTFIIIGVGIALIALGTFGIIYGQHEKSKEDSSILQSKIDDVLKNIGEVKKGETNEVSVGKIQKTEQEFEIWASEFMKNRERKKVELARTQLDSIDTQLKVSNEWRPIFEHVLQTIDSLARAYNTKSSEPIKVDFPAIPENLYSAAASAYPGKVVFPNKAMWFVEFMSSLPPTYPPSMNICFQHQKSSSFLRLNYLSIRIRSSMDKKEIDLTIYGKDLPTTDGIEGSYPLDSYRDKLKTIIRRLFEAELLRN